MDLRPRHAVLALALVPGALFALAGCDGARNGPPPAAAPDPEYVRTIDEWRRSREERLMRPDGWLSVAGLHWLKPGVNVVGSGPEADVRLEAPGVPPRAATLVLDAGAVRLQPERGSGLTLGDAPAEPRTLRDDTAGEPDVLRLGRLSFHVIRRGERFGVRVKDPEAPTRTHFAGLTWYPIDPAARVAARYTPFDAPREVEVADTTGATQRERVAGVVTFPWGGRELTMLPFGDPGEPLFLVFNDATSGEETYGAARFLYADPPQDGTVVLDFNKAYNPPCAFTDFATCPLPLRENRLAVPIRAGEKKYAGGHAEAGAAAGAGRGAS